MVTTPRRSTAADRPSDPDPSSADSAEDVPTSGDAVETAAQAVHDDFNQAWRDHSLELHRAWSEANQASWKAHAELAAAQNRIALEAGFQRNLAYHVWFRAVQTVRAEEGGNGRLSEAYSAYYQSMDDIARKERTEWEQALKAYREAISSVNETHAKATQDAARSYLEQVKRAWGSVNVSAPGTAGFLRLAQISAHAARTAHALQWGKP